MTYPTKSRVRVAAVADEVAVQRRPDRTDALGDGEEDRDGLRSHLEREDLADGEVGDRLDRAPSATPFSPTSPQMETRHRIPLR
jgi:hypothetical protein